MTPPGLVAMVLLILGILMVPAGLVITLVAWQMYRTAAQAVLTRARQ